MGGRGKRHQLMALLPERGTLETVLSRSQLVCQGRPREPPTNRPVEPSAGALRPEEGHRAERAVGPQR